MYIDQVGEMVTAISNPNADANAIENIGMLFLKGGSVTAPKGNAILDGVASMEITGGTITGKNGIKLKEWSSSLTEEQNLKHTIKAGTISGDEADIYLGKNRQINIAEEYNAQLTVLTEDPSHGRQVTAKTNGTNYQNNLNLISKNENYRIGYQKNDADKEYRYLIAQHTVNAVDAEAKVGENVVSPTDLVDADTTVTVTAKEIPGKTFTDWTVKLNGVKQDNPENILTKPDANDPTKVTFTMPDADVEVTANFKGIPTLNIGDHVTANIEGNDASVPSGSTVPVGETVHLTATAPEGQHFIGWTVKVGGEEQKADTFLKTPDADDPTKVSFVMPDADVEVTATFADDPIPEPDPVGPSDTGNIQGAISAVVIGAAAGAIIYEAGTGIYRVINMPGIPMPSNRIELAELLWEHAGKPEPVSTALYSDIDEGDTDAQKAARWAVEQDLMKDDADNNKFHPAFPVSKLRTCLTWNAAKEKGLFDKTEE